jgi:hypothetical protein
MFLRKADNLPFGKNQGKLAVALEQYENPKRAYSNFAGWEGGMTPLERQRRDALVSELRAQNETRSKASLLGRLPES